MQKKQKSMRPRGAHPQPQRVSIQSARSGANKENLPEYNFEKLMKIVEENIPKLETTPQYEEDFLNSSLLFSPAHSQLNESGHAPQTSSSPRIASRKSGGGSRYQRQEKKVSPCGGKKETHSKRSIKERKLTREEKKEVKQEDTEEEVARQARELDEQMEAIQRKKTALLIRHFEEELEREFTVQKKQKQTELEKEHEESVREMHHRKEEAVKKIKDMKSRLQSLIQFYIRIVKDMESKEDEVQECLSAALADLSDRRETKERQLEENFQVLKNTRVETFKKYISKRNI